MKKNKIFSYVMTGALSLGLVGGGVHAFAATSSKTTTTSKTAVAANVKSTMDSATKQKVQTIMDDLKTKLSALGVQMPEKGGRHGGHGGDLFANLDAATKAKAEAIFDQVRAGTITKEEAKTKLAALGVNLLERGDHGGKGPFANLDAATKAKVQAIFDQERAGTITKEEAKTKLAALGVMLPERGDHDGKGPFANLDAATKAKAEAIFDQERAGTITKEEAKTKLAALGVTLPERGEDILANLDATTKAKAQALIDKAKAELAKLGVDHLPFGKF